MSLTSSGEDLDVTGEIDVTGEGDSLSPLLFVLSMVLGFFNEPP